MHTNMSKITIVTAFFDIGRGEISTQDGLPAYLMRTTDTYFDYFANLAKLENDMVVFVAKHHVEKVLALRNGRPTQIIEFDFANKLNYVKKLIHNVQTDAQFISKINPEQIKNIEYWSADYVLVTNLKVYFINKAIKQGVINTDMVAWIDFGYCRSPETLNGIKVWECGFDPNFIHAFTIHKNKKVESYDDVLKYIFNNDVYIIGGCLVATQNKWQEFLRLLFSNQKALLRNNIIDDDQGSFMMCLFQDPKLFKLNYLGKKQWFALFRKYDKTAKVSIIEKIKDSFI